jgi:hypothetical protein
MLNNISKFQGWPIAEALRRVADRARFFEYIAKCRSAKGGPDLVLDECRLARGLLFEQLRSCLIGRRLIIWGRIGSPDMTLAPIPDKLVQKICFNETPSKDNPQALSGTERIFDVRIFPVLLAPNVAEFVSRISLKNALLNLILGDPEVESLGRVESKRVPPSQFHEVEQSRGYHYWSVDPDITWSHVSDPDEYGEYYCYLGMAGRLAVIALNRRFRALLQLLQREVYLAEGDPTRPNGSQHILPAIWSHEAYFIDDRTGDVLEDAIGRVEKSKIASFGDGREYYKVRWRAVMLTSSKHVGRVAQYEPVILSDPQPQRAPQVIAKVGTLTKCAAWLELKMREDPGHRPKRKQDFLDEARSKWPDLSERRFDRLWEQSIEITGAHAWSFAGAPKRSRSSKQSPR